VPPDVSVVVANYAGDEVLDGCLASVTRQTHLPLEVLVLDAGATERAESIARTYGATRLARANRGVGYLYNEGAGVARGELLLLLNNDVVLGEHCLERLVCELERDPGWFAADPRQLGFDGELVHGLATLRRGPLFRHALPGFRLDLRAPAERASPTVSANGAAMLVRRDRLLELGGFDETMFMDFEDIDLCWRAWQRGWGSVHVPEATLRHRVGVATTEAGALRPRVRSSHHNLVRFALKCFPPADACRVVLGELLRLPRHPSLIAPAVGRIVRELPEIRSERRRVRPSRALMHWMLAGQPEGSQPVQR
jgi:GT2 family glycosyltransferase